MSGNIRWFMVGLTVVLGSFAVVRSIAASPEAVLDDPPISMAVPRRVELADAPLAEAIRHFASAARLPKHDVAR